MSAARPFEGIRIADFSKVLAGPLATMTLADLGADVIRLEDMSGDPLRPGERALFLAMNRNKRSIGVNFRERAGVAIAKQIIDTADIVVESQRHGLMDQLGLGAENLRAERPGLIYASLTAYGRTAGDRRGVDAVIQADTGMAAWAGLNELPLVDASTGMAMAQALMMALYHRERTGEGMTLDVNLLDTALFLQPHMIGHFISTGANLPTYLARYPAHGTFDTTDLPLLLGVYIDSQWKDLCEVIGLEHLIADPRSATIAARQANIEELHELVAARFREKPQAVWLEILAAKGLIAAPINDYAAALADPQVTANGTMKYLDLPDGAKLGLVNVPFAIRDEPRTTETTPPPRHGEHSYQILEALGHDKAAIDDLVERRIVKADSTP
jgi:crotonobetainyl-CoA:carnitine CoA-transferase CaiB-like acyl-CoA transferase